MPAKTRVRKAKGLTPPREPVCTCPAGYPLTVATFHRETLISVVHHHALGQCPMPDDDLEVKPWLAGMSVRRGSILAG